MEQPPPWPGLKNPPRADKRQYVFRNGKGDLVIYLPAVPAEEGVPRKAIGPFVDPLELHLKLSAESTVERSEERIRYTYRVVNLPDSENTALDFSIYLPPGEDVVGSLSGPAGVEPHVINHAIGSCGKYALGLSPHVAAHWWRVRLRPGSAVENLTLLSSLLPGLNLLFGGHAIAHPAWKEETGFDNDEVEAQWSRFGDCEYRERIVVVVGPRFPKDTPPAEIARHFQAGFQALVRDQRLAERSAWLRAARLWLDGIVASGRRPADFIAVPPGEPFEREISAALRISLLASGR